MTVPFSPSPVSPLRRLAGPSRPRPDSFRQDQRGMGMGYGRSSSYGTPAVGPSSPFAPHFRMR